MSNIPQSTKNENHLELIACQSLNGITVGDLGLNLQSSVDEETSIFIADRLKAVERFQSWSFADITRHVLERDFSKAALHLASVAKKSRKYLRAIAAVSKAFPGISDRSSVLDFSHHQIISESFPRDKSANTEDWQDFSKRWIRKAEINRWSCRNLKHAMKGVEKRKRIERDLGYLPRTWVGQKILNFLEPTLVHHTFSLPELEFLGDVSLDLQEIGKVILAKSASPTTGSNGLTETVVSSSSFRQCEAALDEYLSGQRGQRRFFELAHKHGVKAQQLGRHRMMRAAKLRTQGVSFSEIKRRTGVKSEKLRKFLKGKTQPMVM